MTTDARQLVQALREPASAQELRPADWTALIATARAESLMGSLAYRLEGFPLAEDVQRLLEDEPTVRTRSAPLPAFAGTGAASRPLVRN